MSFLSDDPYMKPLRARLKKEARQNKGGLFWGLFGGPKLELHELPAFERVVATNIIEATNGPTEYREWWKAL